MSSCKSQRHINESAAPVANSVLDLLILMVFTGGKCASITAKGSLSKVILFRTYIDPELEVTKIIELDLSNSNSLILFLNSINYSSTLTAVQKMPPSAKMVDCKIIQIQKWIQNGYPQ